MDPLSAMSRVKVEPEVKTEPEVVLDQSFNGGQHDSGEEDLPFTQDISNRPKNNTELNKRVAAYFEDYDPETRTRTCSRCLNILRGNLSHMKNHLASKHKIIAQALGIAQRVRSKRPRAEEAESNNDEEQPQPKKLKEVSINKTISEIVEMFLSGNMSLTIADMLNNIEIIKREFEANNKTLNSNNLKDFIFTATDQMYSFITKEVRGKFPSIMFDSASRNGQNVFLVSLRFANGENLVDRIIGFITQNQQQTAWQLFNQIDQQLSRVGLTFDDIYSTCTDQGANILRAGDLMVEAMAAIRVCRGIANQEGNEGERTNEDINRQLSSELTEQNEDFQMLREEMEVDRENKEQQQAVEEDEATVADVVVEEGFLCTKMVCGAHICEQAAKDVLKDFQPVIAEIRAVVNASKRMEFTEIISDAGIQRLRTDVQARFDSLYQMINDVHRHRNQLKEVAVNEEMLSLSNDAWEFVTEFIQVFTAVCFPIKVFQKAEITVSDLYVRWEKMELQITKVPDGHNKLKSKLLVSLEQHKQKFFECDAFIAALLLDPRINWSQNPDDLYGPALCERGMLQLEKVHQAIANRMKDEEEELNNRLGGGRRARQVKVHPTSIRQKVNKFLTEPRLSSAAKISPLKYWYNKRNDEPEIYSVSQVVYGAAFSQVKVNMDFSGFALVLPYLKTLLGEETLNTILVSKNNLDLLNKVKFF